LRLRTFGTTGRPKDYSWGPGFTAADDFFHRLVYSGSRLGRVARLQVNWLTTSGKDNMAWVQPTPGIPTVYTVRVGVNRPEFMPELVSALAGCDVLACPSGFAALDQMIDMSRHLAPGAILAFTGEPLPATLRSRLTAQGWDVRDQMRSWDGGATFYTCPQGTAHWVGVVADVSTGDGRLVSTDLLNLAQPHVDYWNGDEVRAEPVACRCGRPDGVRLAFGERNEVRLVRAKEGMTYNYQSLFALAEAAAKRARAGPLLAVAFGVEGYDAGRVMEVSYVISGPAVEFERAATELFRNVMGVERVDFRPGVVWEDRKLRRLYLVGETK